MREIYPWVLEVSNFATEARGLGGRETRRSRVEADVSNFATEARGLGVSDYVITGRPAVVSNFATEARGLGGGAPLVFDIKLRCFKLRH